MLFATHGDHESALQGFFDTEMCLVSLLKEEKLMSHGCKAFIAFVGATPSGKIQVSDIPVVAKFTNSLRSFLDSHLLEK